MKPAPEAGTEGTGDGSLPRAEAAYVEFFRAMARVSPEGAIAEEDGLVLVATGHALPMLNFAVLTRAPADSKTTLERARRFYGQRGLGFMLDAGEAPSAELLSVLTNAGMEQHTSQRMLLTPLAGSPSAEPGLTVSPVRDLAALRLYNQTMTAGFGGMDWIGPALLRDKTLLQALDVTHYVGFVDGRAVATAMRFASHRIAVIFNVSVVPAYRRQGIGEAITWRAALDGLQEGCVAAYLQASELGFPVYVRMGFEHVGTHRMWLARASE